MICFRLVTLPKCIYVPIHMCNIFLLIVCLNLILVNFVFLISHPICHLLSSWLLVFTPHSIRGLFQYFRWVGDIFMETAFGSAGCWTIIHIITNTARWTTPAMKTSGFQSTLSHQGQLLKIELKSLPPY